MSRVRRGAPPLPRRRREGEAGGGGDFEERPEEEENEEAEGTEASARRRRRRLPLDEVPPEAATHHGTGRGRVQGGVQEVRGKEVVLLRGKLLIVVLEYVPIFLLLLIMCGCCCLC